MSPQTTGRLPVQLVPLVGRQRELRDVLDTLSLSRLVTLTGPGGTGKTRLAAAVADAAGASYSRGVCWVELAPIDDPRVVPLAVAAALGMQKSPGQDVTERVISHVADQRVLMVLDNCEHLAAAAAAIAYRLLRACPSLSILATSREVLGVDGEHQIVVPPLALPADDADPALTGFDAIRLFEQRAQLTLPSFAVTKDNAAAVLHICRRLDGLPLAIELAAARLRLLSLGQLAERLDDIFSVLVGGARTAPQRHQTLRATLDWSHDLLDPAEQAVFRRLAVFAGGFSLAAAEEVTAGGDIPPERVLGLLTRLADRSLLSVDHSGAEARYHLLATVRDYARECLAAAPEENSTRQAHLRFFADFVEMVEPRLLVGADGGVDIELELNRLQAETANIRAALDFARASGDVRAALRIAGPLERYAYLRGQYSEVRNLMDAAVTVGPDAPAVLLAKALLGSGRLALLQCDYDAAADRLEAALKLYRNLEDARGIARALQWLGSIAREQGNYTRAVELTSESLAIAEASGDRAAIASAHGYLGFASWLQRDFDRAATECEIALVESSKLGDVEGTVWGLLSLGIIARYQGQRDRAAFLLSDGRARSERLGFREGIAWSLEQLGLLAVEAGDPEAGAMLRSSLAMHRDLRDRWRVCGVLEDLAALAMACGDAGQAARLLGAAQAGRDAIGSVVAPCESAQHERTLAGARAVLSDDQFEAAWQQGMLASIDDLLSEPVPAEPAGAGAGRAIAARPGVARAQPARVSARSSEPLRIRALGVATVHRADVLVTVADWGYGKPRELLFLLATSPPMTREQVGVALWPDQPPQRLGNALHTALRELRRALGDPGWVVYSDGHYSFNRARQHDCDVETFERALAAARRVRPEAAAGRDLQRAVDAYGGDFLADLAVGEWAQVRRDELRRSFESALMALGRLHVAAARYQPAVTAFRRAVAHDPLNESAHRELMSALARLGEPARAVRHYRELAELLRDQVGVPPAAETTALYQHLLGKR